MYIQRGSKEDHSFPLMRTGFELTRGIPRSPMLPWSNQALRAANKNSPFDRSRLSALAKPGGGGRFCYSRHFASRVSPSTGSKWDTVHNAPRTDLGRSDCSGKTRDASTGAALCERRTLTRVGRTEGGRRGKPRQARVDECRRRRAARCIARNIYFCRSSESV